MHDLLTAQNKTNLLALDQIQDPMNFGAIIRSANATGIGAVICPKDRSAPLREVAINASSSAARFTPVLYVTNLARSLDELKEAGYSCIVLMPPRSETSQTQVKPLFDFAPSPPWVLVAGSEGHGVRPLVASKADYFVTIPMRGKIESLNVSVACAVALYHLTK